MNRSDEILKRYLQVTQHMSHHFRRHFGKLNLTFPQAMVLSALGTDGPVPISTLAQRTGSANSTISGIVDRLERLGLAVRERSDTDRRVIYVSATERYLQLRSQAQTNAGGYFSSLMDTQEEEEQEKILAGLELLDAALAKDEP